MNAKTINSVHGKMSGGSFQNRPCHQRSSNPGRMKQQRKGQPLETHPQPTTTPFPKTRVGLDSFRLPLQTEEPSRHENRRP